MKPGDVVRDKVDGNWKTVDAVSKKYVRLIWFDGPTLRTVLRGYSCLDNGFVVHVPKELHRGLTELGIVPAWKAVAYL